MSEPSAMLARLEGVLAAHGPLAIAVSGGVDSMTLAVAACRAEPATQVFHALSSAVPADATQRVLAYASRFGWQLRCIDAGEMHDPAYRANPVNRCYYCKSNLYRAVHAHTSLTVASGTNLDDLADYRPGLDAAREQRVMHPLVDAGMRKTDVRALAAHLGLRDLQQLPASPCLSSRIATGIAIDADLLPLIDLVERSLRALLHPEGAAGDLRCRVRGTGIDIETDQALTRALEARIREAVSTVFAATPFAHYAQHIGIGPYRKGSAFVRVAS